MYNNARDFYNRENAGKEMKTYKEAETYLYEVPKFTTKSTPEMTRAFYEFIGCPGEKKNIVHVAGTNGKGSVCTYLSSILTAHGYKTAMFTSPHLISMCERFRIDGTLMTEEEFVFYYEKVREKLEECRNMLSQGEIPEGMKCLSEQYHPTFFEYLFFMAMLWFEAMDTDYIVLETGLGGRLDATNVIKAPKLCIITKIGLDHTMYLGNTVEEIAGEKAGIIKDNIPLIYLDFDNKVSDIMKKEAGRHNAKAYAVGNSDILNVKIHEKDIDFSMFYGYDKCVQSAQSEFCIPTVALYQTLNATLAVKASHYLLGADWKLALVKTTLARTVWEGRMEEVLPGFYVDGAHNEDGVEAFVDSLSFAGVKEAILLFGVNGDKDYAPMIARLAGSGFFKQIVLTKLAGERSAKPEMIAEQFSRYTDAEIRITDCVKDAVEECRNLTSGGRIYAVGSLYLVGEIKELVRRNCCD